MSLSVVPAHWLQVGIAAAEGDGGFEAPGTEDFFWPVVGGDSNWAITRPGLVMAISVGLLAWFFVTVAGKLTVVPSKRQWMAEQAYGFVRNSIARSVSNDARSVKSGFNRLSSLRCRKVPDESARSSARQRNSLCLKYSTCRGFMNASSSEGR